MTTFKPSTSLLTALAGFALGSVFYLVVRSLGQALLPGACAGHTVVALLPPLLLGPGGIALATSQISRGGRPALGIGLVISSLFPALGLGVRDISNLRTAGCAGGYVVFGTLSGESLPELRLRPGETVQITVRPSGFQGEGGSVKLSTKVPAGVLSAVLEPESVPDNTAAKLSLSAARNAAIQQYTVSVVAQQRERSADGQLTVTVRP